MAMRVFVTGASGYLGAAIAARLVKGDCEVQGLVRSEESAELVASLGVKPVIGDLEKPETFLSDLKNNDAVVHAALRSEHETARLDRLALETIRAGVTDGRVRHLLYTSGVWVHGDTEGRTEDETATLHPAEYSAWRPAHEEAALDMVEQEAHVTVMRPGMVYGGIGGEFDHWFREARERTLVTYPGGGIQHWSDGKWSTPGELPLYVHSLQRWRGDLFAGGSAFTHPNSPLQRWNNQEWVSVYDPSNHWTFRSVQQLTSVSRFLYARGEFEDADGIPKYILRWDGTNWTSLPGELDELLTEGETLYGLTRNEFYRWEDPCWTFLTFTPDRDDPAIVSQGALITCGVFVEPDESWRRPARWDGLEWENGVELAGNLEALVAYHGALIAGGIFLADSDVIRPDSCLAVWKEPPVEPALLPDVHAANARAPAANRPESEADFEDIGPCSIGLPRPLIPRQQLGGS